MYSLLSGGGILGAKLAVVNRLFAGFFEQYYLTTGTPGNALSFLFMSRTPLTDFARPRIGRGDQSLTQTRQ
jgi:hypothetical protein